MPKVLCGRAALAFADEFAIVQSSSWFAELRSCLLSGVFQAIETLYKQRGFRGTGHFNRCRVASKMHATLFTLLSLLHYALFSSLSFRTIAPSTTELPTDGTQSAPIRN